MINRDEIPFHSKDSIKIFLDTYSIEYDETNSFPKYLYLGLDEYVGTLTEDNLIFELCEKLRDLRKMTGDFVYDKNS